MSAAEIRRAGPNDIGELLELHRAFCAVDDHPFDPVRAEGAFAPLLDDDAHGVVWLVDDPPAYAVLTWGWSIEAGGAEAVLDEVYSSQRGRGVGQGLIEHLIADARQRGIVRIFLETERHNDRARELYRRHGFVVDDSIWMSLEFTALS